MALEKMFSKRYLWMEAGVPLGWCLTLKSRMHPVFSGLPRVCDNDIVSVKTCFPHLGLSCIEMVALSAGEFISECVAN